jgi:alkylglycerol monooxygenase
MTSDSYQNPNFGHRPNRDMNLINFSIPLFFLPIGLEVLFDRLNGGNSYRFNDAIANISCGIGEQVTGIFFKIVVVTLYEVVFKKYALFHIPIGWISGAVLFWGVDFFYYWFHRYSHTINLFWAGHVVHHQSEEYNYHVHIRCSPIPNNLWNHYPL